VSTSQSEVPWKHWPRYDRLGRLFLDPHYLLSLATTAYEEKVFLKIGINNAANYANRWAYTYNRSERPSEQNSNYNLLPPMRKLSTEGALPLRRIRSSVAYPADGN
jgi:hypothetical protein